MRMSAFTFPSCRSRSRPIEPGRVQPWRVANCPRRAERGELPQYVATGAPSGHRAACPPGRVRGAQRRESRCPAALRRHARPRGTTHEIGTHYLRRVLAARRSVTCGGSTAAHRFGPENRAARCRGRESVGVGGFDGAGGDHETQAGRDPCGKVRNPARARPSAAPPARPGVRAVPRRPRRCCRAVGSIRSWWSAAPRA